jgi:hypothetical protein
MPVFELVDIIEFPSIKRLVEFIYVSFLEGSFIGIYWHSMQSLHIACNYTAAHCEVYDASHYLLFARAG